ncbi:MAG: Tyrosine recombinase XerC [Elusimicrobia bacterium]|nr:Tyrosine recombinase XerC [Elusimicrobiota bacterium]
MTSRDRISTLFDVSEDVLHTEFTKAVKAAGIQDFRFHDLRHSFASHFIMRTNDLPTLQKLLGHHSPAMTQRYAHLSKGHIQVGMLTFDAGMDVILVSNPQKQLVAENSETVSAPIERIERV